MISKKRVTGSCSCDPICRSICAPLGRTIFVDVLTLLKIAIQSNLWIQNRLGVFLTRNSTTYLCIINVYSGFGLTIDVLKDFMLGNEARALKPFMQVYRVGSNTKVSKETLKKNFSANTRGRWNTILFDHWTATIASQKDQILGQLAHYVTFLPPPKKNIQKTVFNSQGIYFSSLPTGWILWRSLSRIINISEKWENLYYLSLSLFDYSIITFIHSAAKRTF